jgi:hypothetical protein
VIGGKIHPGVLVIFFMPTLLLSILLPGVNKLSIRLTDKRLDLQLGVFSRRIDLSDVTKISIVSVPNLAGWGVRYSFSGGELWRVTGTRAVKFELRNGSGFHLGLHDPESLETALKLALQS